MVAGLLVLVACSRPEPVTTPSLGAYPAPTDLLETGDVVAEVGPVVFTTGELERRLAGQSPYVRAQLRDPESMKRWVENEVRIEALAQRAWEKGLQNEPRIQARIRALLVEELTKREMKAAAKGLEPNNAELMSAFEERRAEFEKPAKVRLSQIVRYVETASARKAARKLLEKVKSEVIAGQKRNDHRVFVQSAKKHSQDDATKLAAGDLQFLTKDELAERYGKDVANSSFDDAEVGDLFIADAPNAVVLFKKTGRRREVKRTLEEVRSQLRAQLMQQNRQAQFEAWSKEILQKAGVTVDETKLGKITVPGAPAPTPAAPN